MILRIDTSRRSFMAIAHINQVELSRRWRLSPRTLEGWRHRGIGPQYLKIGGRIVYRLDDIEAFETRHIHKAGGTAAKRPTAPLRVIRNRQA
jgi:hypothetical protein